MAHPLPRAASACAGPERTIAGPPEPARGALPRFTYRESTLRRPRLLPPRVASQWKASRGAARHKGTRRFRAIGTSESQDPVHRDPHRAFARLRLGEGLLWSEPLVDVCNETLHTGTSTRPPPRPPIRSRAPRGARDPQAFAPRSPDRVSPVERAVRDAPHAARTERCAPNAPPALSRERPEMQPRADCPEAKGSQPFKHFASSPPSKAAEHSFVVDSLPRKPGGPPPRLRVVHRARFPRRRGAAFGITNRPRSSFPRRPAKVGVFPKTRVLFTDRRRAGGRVAPRPCGSVCASRRPPLMGWGIANRQTSAFFAADRAPRPDEPSVSEQLDRWGPGFRFPVGRRSQRPLGFYVAYSLAD